MQEKLMPAGVLGHDPIQEFGQKLGTSLGKGNLVRLVLSHPVRRGPGAERPGLERVLARCVCLKGTPHLSVTLRYPTRDEVKNLPLAESVDWIMARLQAEFRSALLCTTERDWQVSIAEDHSARLIQHRPSMNTLPSVCHDRSKRSLLDESATDWLSALNVRDRSGRLRPAMADKYRQISRYLEILSHLSKDCGWSESFSSSASEAGEPRQLVIADMGCGKGYLTFGAWHLFRRVWNLPARIIGVEARPELVAQGNRVAAQIGASELEFIPGTIDTVEIPSPDVLIALHACDTATDQAIERGIRCGAQVVVVAPCCHKELRPKLTRPKPLAPLLQYGLLEERFSEWLTDGLRALFLEWAGYRTRVLEFVASEHSPKNLMIAAVRDGLPFVDAATRQRIDELKAFLGLNEFSLDSLALNAHSS